MTNWRKKIRIKHLLTASEKHKDIQESMNKISEVLKTHAEFAMTSLCSQMKHIPKGDDVITPTDYANKLIAKMYDIADEQRLWIE